MPKQIKNPQNVKIAYLKKDSRSFYKPFYHCANSWACEYVKITLLIGLKKIDH